jgi:hypothetical protein
MERGRKGDWEKGKSESEGRAVNFILVLLYLKVY